MLTREAGGGKGGAVVGLSTSGEVVAEVTPDASLQHTRGDAAAFSPATTPRRRVAQRPARAEVSEWMHTLSTHPINTRHQHTTHTSSLILSPIHTNPNTHPILILNILTLSPIYTTSPPGLAPQSAPYMRRPPLCLRPRSSAATGVPLHPHPRRFPHQQGTPPITPHPQEYPLSPPPISPPSSPYPSHLTQSPYPLSPIPLSPYHPHLTLSLPSHPITLSLPSHPIPPRPPRP